ncbi:alpha/beta hydrolase [Hymenobacter sp. 15J16-1T3B]|uniref:alpha/beta hydrolase n=1 Tax=Hymenobacter sp. 15J16-1T3B TaxID=2886941 RepID=UPI001D111036|nr:alpha/beta hydrolase [Hymenobacter sp. 15J16-1T3B]MCC3156345.1 alpha/beta hydrolase [Hymenobacter sp. 15J16-1T3B]
MTFRRWLAVPALLLVPLLLGAANEYAVARASHRSAEVAYVPATDPDYDAVRHRLDVYAQREGRAAPRPVVVFIHGGSWNSGNKDFYRFVGRRLARLGLVAVVINYRLAPQVRVPQMADDCARAVLWVQAHIGEYGGDAGRIYLLGHSAGGGLAAWLATDDALFARRGQPRNPVRGVVLDDAAGLDMYDYLQRMEFEDDRQYLVPFGPEPAGWRAASALYHLRAGVPPFLVFVGEKTYPSITRSNETFRQRLAALGAAPPYHVLPGKKHAAMVLQLYWSDNVIYRELLAFIQAGGAPRS